MKKYAEISERLARIITSTGETPNNFAKLLGYIRSQTIYDILNGKSSPSCDFFKRFISSEFSVIYSLDWLIAGKGEMLKKEQPEAPAKTDPATFMSLVETIKQQAEEIGQLRQQLQRMKQTATDNSN